MSFETDITEVKKGLFKPATPKDVARRPNPKVSFADPKIQAYYEEMIDSGFSSDVAKARADYVVDNGFADPIMQQQYLTMIMDDGASVQLARATVIRAHQDYFGDSAVFYGIPEA